jgi:small subunit ribosomal protein S16
MLKIRLRRMGARNRPFYRVVVSDSRQVPTGAAIEEIGYYDPLQDPPTVEIKKDRVEHWVSLGAGLSSTVQNLLRRA